MSEEIIIEEPLIEEAEEPKEALKVEAPKEPELDLAALCDICGFKYSGCHNVHMKVTTSKLVLLNGKRFDPGEHIIPAEAYGTFLNAI